MTLLLHPSCIPWRACLHTPLLWLCSFIPHVFPGEHAFTLPYYGFAPSSLMYFQESMPSHSLIMALLLHPSCISRRACLHTPLLWFCSFIPHVFPGEHAFTLPYYGFALSSLVYFLESMPSHSLIMALLLHPSCISWRACLHTPLLWFCSFIPRVFPGGHAFTLPYYGFALSSLVYSLESMPSHSLIMALLL